MRKSVFLLSMVAAAIIGCGGGGDDAQPQAAATVTYTATAGGTPMSITYATAGGGTAQRSGVSSFSETFVARPGDFLYISAQTTGGTSFSSANAKIAINGSTFKNVTSNGPHVIATASGSCC